MELTKQDTTKAKGVAIIGMVMLHLFCRLGDLPYTPLIWIGNSPLIYYLGLFGDICVPIFCFCSGYAHYLLQQQQGTQYKKRIPGKLLRFLINYWIVVVIFSVLGLCFDKTNSIPGSFETFVGNIFLYKLTYNGAWWFVITYIFLLLASPFLTKLASKLPTLILLISSSIIYLIMYIFRFEVDLDIQNPVLSWFWQQFVLFGTSQFGYVLGILFCKGKWFGILRNRFSDSPKNKFLRKALIVGFPVLAFVGHCMIQSLFVAPFTALAVMVSLFLAKLPKWLESILFFMGQHSTNIWLVHMFFYLTPFEGLVFRAKSPVFIVAVMFVLCITASMAINFIYTPICNRIPQR